MFSAWELRWKSMAFLLIKLNGAMCLPFITNAGSGRQPNPSSYLARQMTLNSIPMLRDVKLLNCDGEVTLRSLKANYWIIGMIFLLCMLARVHILKQF